MTFPVFRYKMLSLDCLVNVYIFSDLGYHKFIPGMEGRSMATKEHRSMTNYIEYVLRQHLEQIEREHGEIETGKTE